MGVCKLDIGLFLRLHFTLNVFRMKVLSIQWCISLSFFGFLLLSGCEREDAPLQDAEIKPYVERFAEEALKRGFDFSEELSSIRYEFEETRYGGVCYRFENRFIINRTYWTQLEDLGKEYLVFHELGHCVLDRRHENEYLPAGECSSIMKGTEDDRRCGRNQGFGLWREYYVDELFDSNEPLPAWYVADIPPDPANLVAEKDAEGALLLSSNFGALDATLDHEIVAQYDLTDRIARVEISWAGRRLFFGQESAILNAGEDLRYFNPEWAGNAPSTIRLVQRGNFVYIFAKGELFHVDEIVPQALSSVRMEVSVSQGDPSVPMRLEVYQL